MAIPQPQDPRENVKLRALLDECDMGSRELFRLLYQRMQASQLCGWIRIDVIELAKTCNRSEQTIYSYLADLRFHGVIRRTDHSRIYCPLIVREYVPQEQP
jgi:hypothetical protein